jgi:hypothetical protein
MGKCSDPMTLPTAAYLRRAERCAWETQASLQFRVSCSAHHTLEALVYLVGCIFTWAEA